MEFFDWFGIPQIVMSYITYEVQNADEAAAQMLWIQTICLIVAAGLYLVTLLCGGFGLMTMAKKQGIKYWWIGFLPFGNTFLAGRLAGETQIFGQKCKRIGLYAMLAEIVYVALEVVLLVFDLLLTQGDFFVETTGATSVYFQFSLDVAKQYPEFAGIANVYDALGYIAQIWWFVLLFLFVFLFSAFFRKYYARSPFLMTFLCAFLPLRGFVLLAVRNNTPVDYNDYLRRRYEQMYSQRYGEQGGNPYPGGGQYGAGNKSTDGEGDPFSEFGRDSGHSDGGFDGGHSGGGSDGNAPGEGGTGSNDSPFSDF